MSDTPSSLQPVDIDQEALKTGRAFTEALLNWASETVDLTSDKGSRMKEDLKRQCESYQIYMKFIYNDSQQGESEYLALERIQKDLDLQLEQLQTMVVDVLRSYHE